MKESGLQEDVVSRRRYLREKSARTEAERLLETISRELYEANRQLSDETRKLRAEHKRAEASERAKGKFLATVSHELRTPMNGILGMAALMEKTQLDETQRSMLRVMTGSARDLLVIIEDMLDFATLESGAAMLNRTIFEPLAMAEACLERYRPEAEARGLSLTAAASECAQRRLVGDEGRIRQIRDHLISNAVRFTETGGVEIRLRCSKAPDQRVRLSVDVTDTGVGMNADAMDCLFLPFGLADSSATRPFGGVGIGLAITRRLCRLMGGNVSVESTVGRGSTFQFHVIVDHAPPESRDGSA